MACGCPPVSPSPTKTSNNIDNPPALHHCMYNGYLRVHKHCTHLEQLFNESLVILEASFEVFDVELEEVERRGAGLTKHAVEAYVGTHHRIQVHPQGHRVQLARLVKLIQEHLHVKLSQWYH